MLRRAALVCCLLLAVPATSAVAGPACPQLTDAVGDQQPATDPAADLLAVSLGSTQTAVTAVLKYGGEQPAQLPVNGHTYVVALDSGEATLLIWADVAPRATTFELYRGAAAQGGSSASGYAATAVGPLSGRVDTVAHTVTATVPFALVPDVLRPGRRLTLSASVSTSIVTPDVPVTGHAFATQGSDEGDESPPYRLGGPGCR
ncbi:MAG: hypothetical protein JWP11_163 [Frankiales bacterium]|nr:hypothetical protein [Frankiales bacterium]